MQVSVNTFAEDVSVAIVAAVHRAEHLLAVVARKAQLVVCTAGGHDLLCRVDGLGAAAALVRANKHGQTAAASGSGRRG